MYVMLQQNWPGNFRRSILDGRGDIVETLEFTPGEVREFDDDGPEAAAIARDVGKALQLLAPDDRRVLRSSLAPVADGVEITPGGPPSTPTTIVPAADKPPTKSERKAQRKAAVAAASQPAVDPLALPPIDDAPAEDDTV